MSGERRFPVLNPGESASIPWEAIEPLRALALRAHEQSVETLARRGGLSWGELGHLYAALACIAAGVADERISPYSAFRRRSAVLDKGEPDGE